MTKKYWIRSIAIAFMSFFIVTSISATSQSRTLLVRISRLPQLDGTTKFEMDLGAFVHLANGETPSEIRPGFLAHPNFVFDSLSEFKAAAIGEWTIEDQMTPFSPRETFKLQVSDFFDTISSIVPPTIVSPMDVRQLTSFGAISGAVAACWSAARISSAESTRRRRLLRKWPSATSAISAAAAAASSGASKSANPSYSPPGV